MRRGPLLSSGTPSSSSSNASASRGDRDAVLDEWRRQSRATAAGDTYPGIGSNNNNNNNNNVKRQRLHRNDGQQQSHPPLPPSGSSSSGRAAAGSTKPPPPPGGAAWSTDGTTALDRFRKRKLLLQQQNQNQNENGNGSFDGVVGSSSSSSSVLLHFDDDEDATVSFCTSRNGNRRSTMTGRPRRMTLMPTSSSRRSLLAPSVDVLQHHQQPVLADVVHVNNSSGQNSNNNSNHPYGCCTEPSASLSQLTVESDPLPMMNGNVAAASVGLVEGAGLRSQVQEMERRIEQLEKEKMVLSMAKAPLEARFRQREDEWIKEQTRLLQEIESLKAESREASERCSDLVLKYESSQEEATKLRLEVRKASSTLNNATNQIAGGTGAGAGTSAWSRQLQNDRDVLELKGKLRSATEDLNLSKLAKASIEKELQATRIELDALSRGYEELQAEYDEISKTTSDNRDAEIRLEVLTEEHVATSAQLNAVAADLAATKARAHAAQTAADEVHKKEVDVLNFEISVLKTRAGKNDHLNHTSGGDSTSGIDDDEDAAVLMARIEERERRIRELEAEVLRGEEIRRQMHNRIQELRGNIRVFVRTRPFLPSDKQRDMPAIDVSPDGESLSIADARSNSDHSFKFDKVFPPSSGQDQVFDEVSDFVQSALDGYQVCLFSYGQTGSGKTHTMQGSGNGAMRGIIPRAVEQILKTAKVMQMQKWDFQLSASFLEIYNENLKDLLASMSQDDSVRQNPPKLSIKRNREGKSYVEGLTEVQIETVDSGEGMTQLDALMAVAARSRSVASTKMNAQSSRSHSVFMLHIRGYNEDSEAEVHGSLNLCDLAGSERLDRSGASADAQRLRETQSINKSLSCLGDVFNALSKGASHIPYRNSKLTYLLQDCLSGDGKALMFVNLSPTTASSNESLCSLRFAQRVNQVELGKPTKNIQYKTS